MPIESATKISELDAANPVGASDLPSTIDDHIRLIKTVLKADAASTSGGAGVYVGTVGGTADAITLAPTSPTLAYAAGLSYAWIASGANTGATTLAVSGLAAKAVKKNGTTALAAGDIPSGALVRATYDGTNFQITVVADRATIGVTAGTAVQVDQAVTATTRSATTTLGTTLNHTLSDSSTTITAFNGVAGVTYKCRALGAGDITHHATNLIITQGLASITTAAGMTFDVEMITSTTCRIKNIAMPAALPATRATNAFTGAQIGGVTALTSSSASISIDLAVNNNFSHTTSENTTLAAPSNPVAGQSGIITITQGGTARTLAYNTFYKFAGGTIPALTATIGAVDVFAYYVESATRATCQLIKDVK
jgi:hypothetical protein